MLDHARVTAAVSVRAPLRIALGGGGTDLPSHYREHGGFVVSAAIDRRVHVTVSPARGRSDPARAPRAGGGGRPRRDPPPDPARRDRAALERPAARALLDGRRAARHRPRLVGRLHGVRRQGARAGRRARPVARRAGRGGVRDRARRPRAHRRQAGPVRGRARRRERVHVRARRHRGRAPARALRPRPARRCATASSCSSPARAARRPRSSPTRSSARCAGDSELLDNLLRTEELARAAAAALEAGDLDRVRRR